MALAKIRALHPDIFSDDDLCEVSIPARWLYAGLWCYACDNGHLADRPKQIKRWIFASDDVSVADLLRELENVAEVIERPIGGWIFIPGLPKRNRIDWRYFKACDYPGGCEKPAKKGDSPPKTQRVPSGATSGTLRDHATDGDGDGVRDGDGDGDGEVTTSAPTAVVATPKGSSRGTRRPSDFRPSQAHIDLAAELAVDLRAEWQQFCDHHDAKGTTYKDWPAALRTWIRNAAKYGRRTTTGRRGDIDWNAAMDRARAIDEANGATA